MKLLALDFDGVISDSAPEAFVVALRTFYALHPGARILRDAVPLLAEAALPPPGVVAASPLYAPFLDMMPLGNRAEDYAVVLTALESGRVCENQGAYDTYKAGLDSTELNSFRRCFYEIRTALADAEPKAWHRLIGAYPGILDLLRRRAGDAVLAIATAKDRGAVGRLLRAYGIGDLFPDGSVLDKDTGVKKRTHLEQLRTRFGFAPSEMTFVDDKVSHLEAVAPLGVRCALAGWGYNGERESARARELGHLVLTLDDVEARLYGTT